MKRTTFLILLLSCMMIGCPDKSAETSFRRGLDMEFRGRYEDAETQFLSLVRELSGSESKDDIFWRVKSLIAAARVENLYMNDPRRAVARLREALRDASDREQMFIAQSEIATIFLDRLGDCRSATPEIEQLVVAFPDREGIDRWRYRLAQCHFTLEQFEQARAEARLLLEKSPDGPFAMEARLLVANSYFVEKKYREALETHQQILDLNPQPQQQARSLFEHGLCYEQIGDLDLAEKSFLGALQGHPRPDLVRGKLISIRKRILEMPRGSEKSPEKTKIVQQPLPEAQKKTGIGKQMGEKKTTDKKPTQDASPETAAAAEGSATGSNGPEGKDNLSIKKEEGTGP